jgi:hypothetical protein
MVSFETVRKLALAFEEAEELPHFEKTSFRIKKKIFATLNVKENRACLKLSETDQSVFCAFDKEVMYPVPNKWGKQGWTLVNLKNIRKDMFSDAINCAYCAVAPDKLAARYRIG